VHALILFLILAPILGSSDFTRADVEGGGGPGPAGGGGGGNNGSGSPEQRIEFVRVQADPVVMPTVTPLTVPPVKPPEPKPPVESPVTPAQQVTTPPVTTAATGEAAAGSAGTAGAGPGSGGGVGSGEGPGRGSSIGPGTGGGPGKDYPPTVRDLFIPPMPAPSAVKGFHLKAFFDVDEKGNAKLLGFNPTRDGDYNKRVADVLKSMRFRPGVRADGTAKRDTAEIEIIF